MTSETAKERRKSISSALQTGLAQAQAAATYGSPARTAGDTPPAAMIDQTVLLALHSSYVDRYQKDNDRTWTSATWLVAVAWALFPAALALKSSLTQTVVVVFATASIALVLLWFLIASWHRVWASRSYDIVRALEIVLLTQDQEAAVRKKVKDANPGPKGLGGHPMRILRWLIVVGTIAGWTVMWWLVGCGHLTFPETN